MSLYPSLEDMEADHMIKAQLAAIRQPPAGADPHHHQQALVHHQELYPSLMEFMGLELTQEMQKQLQHLAEKAPAVSPMAGVVAPLSGQSAGLARAHVSHGIRQMTLCKDGHGKIGLRCQAVSKGIFVSLVQAGSPAALAGLRFGDQILQVNGTSVAGWSMDKVHDLFKKAGVNDIRVAVRDRPFERTITLHKDSFGHVGFALKNGEVVSLVKDSSAARNGLLTDHNLLEVNGQNVVGLKDKEVIRIIEGAGNCVTITVMPSFLFDHMIKNMSGSLLKKAMDHSIPDL